MNEVKLIETFYSQLPMWKSSLSNLIGKLGPDFDDVIQQTLLKLIEKNKQGVIDESQKDGKGYMFMILRNYTIIALNKLETRNKKINGNYNEHIESLQIPQDSIDELERKEEMEELMATEVKPYLSDEDYEFLMEYYNHRWDGDNFTQDEINRKNRLIKRIKRKGFEYPYLIVDADTNETTEHKHKNEIGDIFGMDSRTLKKYFNSNDIIKHKGKKYYIKIRTS